MKHEIGPGPIVAFDTSYGQIIDLDKTRLLRAVCKGLYIKGTRAHPIAVDSVDLREYNDLAIEQIEYPAQPLLAKDKPKL